MSWGWVERGVLLLGVAVGLPRVAVGTLAKKEGPREWQCGT